MKVITLAVVLTLVVGSQCATNCHWGPSYWCQDEVTAEECGGTLYCKDNVWKDEQPQENFCSICRTTIIVIQPFVDGTTIETQLGAIADRICILLPNALESMCNATTDRLIQGILQFLRNEVDDGKICEQIRLCNSTKTTYLKDSDEIRTLPKRSNESKIPVLQLAKSHQHVRPQLPTAYNVCELATKAIKNGALKEQAAALVEKVCGVLPIALQSMCTDTVNKSVAVISQFLKDKVDDIDICKQIDNSTCKSTKTYEKPSVEVSVNWCAACEVVLMFFKGIEDYETTAKAAVEGICDRTWPLNDTCHLLVDSYFTNVSNFLVSLLPDPNQICTKLRVCTNTSTDLPQSAAVQVFRSADVEIIFLCTVCDVVMNQLASLSNATEQAILNALNNVCNLLPSINLQTPCKAFVEQNAAGIIEKILSGLTADKVCAAVGACMGTTSCFVCESSLNVTKNLIIRQATFVANTATLLVDTVCVLMPCRLRDTCRGIIGSIESQAIQLVQNTLDYFVKTEAICRFFMQCPKTTDPILIV